MAGESGRAELSRELVACATELYRRGWCLGTGGNFSAVAARDPLQIVITRSGRPKGTLTAADLLLVDACAQPLDDACGRPSAEARLHAAIARQAGPAAGAILHTHSIFGTLLSERFAAEGGFALAGYEMLKGLAEVRTHEARVHVAVLPNSQDMAPLEAGVARLLAEAPQSCGFLIAGHGLYAWGRSVAEAQARVEVFEFLFEVVGRRTAFAPFEGR